MAKIILFSLGFGVVCRNVYLMSRYWYAACLLPGMLVCYMDKKYFPNEEIENFYRYVLERRKAQDAFSMNGNDFENFSVKLKKNSKDFLNQLNSSKKTMYDVFQEVDEALLNEAVRYS